MIKKLKTIQLNNKKYFVDERLKEIRNINNPHDSESVSKELINYWNDHKWIK